MEVLDTETGQIPPIRSCGSGQEYDYRIIAGAGIITGLFILDILTTQVILAGGGIEYNPFMAGVVQSPLVHTAIKLLLLVLVVVTAEYSETTLKGSGVALFAVIIGWYFICVGNNLGFILIAGLGS